MKKIIGLIYLVTALSAYGVTANKVWRVGTSNGSPSWGAVKIDSSNAVTGTLPVANGGTGQTSFGAGALSSDGTNLSSGTLAIGNGGTGKTSFSSGALSSNGTVLASGTLSVLNGGTGVTTSSGTGSVVLSASPTFTGTVTTAALTASGLITASGGILGSIGTTDATAGNVGEYIEGADTSHPTMTAASGAWQDCSSVLLTAGDWDVSLIVDFESRGASSLSRINAGIGTVTGNSSTGLLFGSNAIEKDFQTSLDTGKEDFITITPYRVKISTGATYYAKINASYTAAPKYDCRLSARRIR